MSYTATSTSSKGRFWPKMGPRLPLNKNILLGIAAFLTVAAAVVLTWMFTAGPLAGGGGRFSTVESSSPEAGFGGNAVPSMAPAPAASGGALSVTVTKDSADNAAAARFARSGLEETAFASSSAARSGVINVLGQQQVISQGSLSVQVANVPTAAARVRAIAESVGGFVEQLSSNGVGEVQQATLTIRVTQDEFFSVFEQIKALGKVRNENAGSEDVTERFIDLEARLKSAQREELSLLSLLDRAQELTRVRTELERVQGQLNFLERRVDLATITVFLTPPQRDDSQAPSGSLTVETPVVSNSVEAVKAMVAQVDGKIDRVFTSIKNERERTLMSVRVFSKDFNLLVFAVEDQGGLVSKEVHEGKAGDSVSPGTESDDPSARLDITFQENESSDRGRNLAIFAPLGSVALVIVLGGLLFGAYRMGTRRED